MRAQVNDFIEQYDEIMEKPQRVRETTYGEHTDIIR